MDHFAMRIIYINIYKFMSYINVENEDLLKSFNPNFRK